MGQIYTHSLLFASILFLLILKSSSLWIRECVQPKVQIVFIQDQTESFAKYVPKFHNISLELIEKIVRKHKTADFGLVSFSDFEESAKLYGAGSSERGGNSESKESSSNSSTCYTRVLPLKDSHFGLDYFKTGFRSLAPRPEDSDENEASMTAILFAATDKHMGWQQTSKELPVTKILILGTDVDTLSDTNNPGLAERPFPSGDGSDDCNNVGIPDPSLVGHVLRENEFKVVALIGARTPVADAPHKLDVLSAWDTYLNEMGVEYIILDIESEELSVTNFTKVLLENVSHNLICKRYQVADGSRGNLNSLLEPTKLPVETN